MPHWRWHVLVVLLLLAPPGSPSRGDLIGFAEEAVKEEARCEDKLGPVCEAYVRANMCRTGALRDLCVCPPRAAGGGGGWGD